MSFSDHTVPRIPLTALAALALTALACSALSVGGESELDPAPTGTSSPSEADAVAATQTPQSEPGLTVSSGDCANDLFPLDSGNQWLYEQRSATHATATPEADDALSLRWTVLDAAPSAVDFELHAEQIPLTATYEIRCQDGALLSFPAVTMNFSTSSTDDGGLDLSYEHVSGEYLPSAATLEANQWQHEWLSELLISGQVSFPGMTGSDGPQVEISESPWTLRMRTTGSPDAPFEAVSVPAGDFDRALRVEQTVTGELTLAMEGAEFTSQVEMLSYHWYVPGVGLVKTETTSTDLGAGGASFPLPLQNQATELVLLKYGKAQP